MLMKQHCPLYTSQLLQLASPDPTPYNSAIPDGKTILGYLQLRVLSHQEIILYLNNEFLHMYRTHLRVVHECPGSDYHTSLDSQVHKKALYEILFDKSLYYEAFS